MKSVPAGSLLLGLLLLAGCASTAPSAPGAPAAEAGVALAGSPAEATAMPAAPLLIDGRELPAPPPVTVADAAPATGERAAPVDPAAAPDPAVDPGRTDAEDDFAALYGAPAGPSDPGARPAYDPWEPANRRVHAFNVVVDRAIARPIARAYVAVVPEPVRLGVGNFFDNLGSPVTFLNQVLQGRPRDAVQTLGRFVVNSTLGIGGLFDPASDLKMKRRSEDFGQTLGIWGWRNSRYVELPFFGPRTVRDVFGLAGDAPLSPTRQVERDRHRIFLQGAQLVDRRAALLPIESMREDAPDEYTMIRDAWLQRRQFQIESDRRREPGDDLPDYLQGPDPVPVDAMPLPGG